MEAAVCGICSEWALQYVGVAVCKGCVDGGCIVWLLGCAEVDICGGCGMQGSLCEKVTMCGGCGMWGLRRVGEKKHVPHLLHKRFEKFFAFYSTFISNLSS